MLTVLSILLCVVGAFNWFAVGVFDFNVINWIFQGDWYVGARITYGLVGFAGMYLLLYLVYNKFSGVQINAPECKWRKKKQAKKQLEEQAEQGDSEAQ